MSDTNLKKEFSKRDVQRMALPTWELRPFIPRYPATIFTHHLCE